MKEGQNIWRRARRALWAELDAFEATLPARHHAGAALRPVGQRQPPPRPPRRATSSSPSCSCWSRCCRSACAPSLVVMVSIPLSLAIGVTLLQLTRLHHQPAQHRRLRHRARPAGRRLDRGGGEHHALPARGALAAARRRSRRPRQITVAVLGCTATLIFAFLPLLAAARRRRRSSSAACRSAVVFTIVASLLVSLTIVPFLASRVLRAREASTATSSCAALTRAIERTYRPVLHRALARPSATLVARGARCSSAASRWCRASASASSPRPACRSSWCASRRAEGASLAETDRAVRFVEGGAARAARGARRARQRRPAATRRSTTTSPPQNERANVGELFVLLARM